MKKKILLIVSGGIAAYKSAELIRELSLNGAQVRCILTRAGAQFITPLTLSSLSGEKVYSELFSHTDKNYMDHIRLSREADLIVVAPASADILARMASGIADDLATTTLLASNKPILVVPAMNTLMWNNPATQRNVNLLKNDSIHFVDPEEGNLACGEIGSGRMANIQEIVLKINSVLYKEKPLNGFKGLITSGPTQEPLDPVRFISNHSSGKQGHALALAAAALGADVTLVSGPTSLINPQGIETINIKTAEEMLNACIHSLPVDFAICCAAVSDWRPIKIQDQKIKKQSSKILDKSKTTIEITENPDILKSLAQLSPDKRPKLLVGFAAETENILEHAGQKLIDKGCDWIIANNVSLDSDTFGNDNNQVTFIELNSSGELEHEEWPKSSKNVVAQLLLKKISQTLVI
tara:strand:- start:3866 stop:5092 length:1227 start_codon:yes stop_codon:yes gene_type:complete